MHVSGFPFDLYPFLQFIVTAFVIAFGILHLVKNTAYKYFTVDANFDEREGGVGRRELVLGKNSNQMVAVATSGDSCAVCGKSGIKQCSRCKRVRYCSGTCQSKHWKEGHSRKCQGPSLFGGLNATLTVSSGGMKASIASKSTKELSQLKKVLFPYEEFVKLFNWGKGGFPPCGLLNCGNSCYANVVLQCLSCTRPLSAYLLEISHRRKCPRTDWCFLCELETHVEKASHSSRPFSPINILSRLPNIGGNLGYGKQEDAHEFMRFAIDTMQSVCLDEYGGEKAIHPDSQETTLIQYIFGGHLQSQVKCSKCNKISYRHENMMDLTVEIQGDAESLVECLDQFTAEECLDGENMYKCDGCNDYVKACKRLAIHCAPNVLTIALKRFQSGRFGKLNKRVTFPEILDLGPYMSEPGYGTDLYRLYAVVVHIDMLNASYFGHYICYTKDFSGNWYRIDDCKVATVDLEEVLSQGAYMLLYSRVCPRPCVRSLESCVEKQPMVEESQSSLQANAESIAIEPSINMPADLRSPAEEEKKQGLVAIEEAKPCSGLPVEFIMVDGPLNSLSTMATDMRSPATEPSSENGDSVCMNIDNAAEVNSRFVENDPPSTSADVPISSESSSLDMDIDGPTMFDPRGDKVGLDFVNPESGSLGTNMDNNGSKHSDAKVKLLEIPSEPSPLVEVHLDRQPAGTNTADNSVDGGDRMGNQELVPKESSADHSVPIQRMIPCSGLKSDIKIVPEKNSASSHCPPLPLSEQLQTAKPDNAIPAVHVSKKNSSKLVGDKSYSNGKQKPMFLRGFLDKHSGCKSPNKKVDVFVKPGEACKGKSSGNGHNKPGVSQVTNVVHGNGTIHPDGLHTPGFVNGRAEKRSNGVGPTDNFSSHEAENDPVMFDHSFPIYADSPGSLLPTGAHDLGHEQESPNINMEHSFGNGYSCNNSASEKVWSLPGQTDQELNAISSSVPVVSSSSDTEMLDESTSVTNSRGQQISSLACTASIEPSDNVKAVQKIQVLSSSSEDGPLGFLEMQTKSEFREKNDASGGVGEVGSSCKANYCNGSTIPGSHFEDCRQATNNDRNSDCYDLSKSTSIIENQHEGTFIYEDERSNMAAHKDGDLPWDQCNGNNSYNDEDETMVCKQDQGRGTFCSNGEVLLTPGVCKKYVKAGEEGPIEMVSSNNEQNKQARLI